MLYGLHGLGSAITFFLLAISGANGVSEHALLLVGPRWWSLQRCGTPFSRLSVRISASVLTGWPAHFGTSQCASSFGGRDFFVEQLIERGGDVLWLATLENVAIRQLVGEQS